MNFYQGCVQVMTVLRMTNQLVQEQQPWTLNNDQEKLDWVLATCFESLRVSGILLQPIVPTLSSALLDKLGVRHDQRHWSRAVPGACDTSDKLSPGKTILFSKIK